MTKLDVEFDHIYIIDCLSESERGEFKDSNRLMAYLGSKGLQHGTSYCANKVEVMQTLNDFAARASSGDKFLLVFISHGDHAFLSIRHTNEIIEWLELRPILQKINASMDEKLVVLMACCHGFKGYKIDKRDSKEGVFFGIVGPDRVITPDESITANEIFFDCLLKCMEIPEAVVEINKKLGSGSYRALAAQEHKLI